MVRPLADRSQRVLYAWVGWEPSVVEHSGGRRISLTYLLGGVALVVLLAGGLVVLARPRPVKRTGRIVSGRGMGAVVVSQLDLHRVLGYEPFEGTANLQLNRRTVLGQPIATARNRWKRYDIWPVTVNGRECHIIHGRHWRTEPKIVEVLAPVALRNNGDVFALGVEHRTVPTWDYVRRRTREQLWARRRNAVSE